MTSPSDTIPQTESDYEKLVEAALSVTQRRLVRASPIAAKLCASVTVSPAGCWMWRRAKTPSTYGYIRHEGRGERAHRLSYRVFCGPIPDGMFVCHHCDTPACINPQHLFIGSAGDNNRDMMRKGRAKIVRGEASGKSILTEASATEILRRHAAGERSPELAKAFDVSLTTVQDLIRGNTWADLPGFTGRSALTHTRDRTACPQGHPYDAENTVIRKRGWRICKTCEKESLRQSRARRKARALLLPQGGEL